VFDHGGDPNHPYSGKASFKCPPLKAVVNALGQEPEEKLKQVKRLIALRADMNALSPTIVP